jgi:hypothetical protein
MASRTPPSRARLDMTNGGKSVGRRYAKIIEAAEYLSVGPVRPTQSPRPAPRRSPATVRLLSGVATLRAVAGRAAAMAETHRRDRRAGALRATRGLAADGAPARASAAAPDCGVGPGSMRAFPVALLGKFRFSLARRVGTRRCGRQISCPRVVRSPRRGSA